MGLGKDHTETGSKYGLSERNGPQDLQGFEKNGKIYHVFHIQRWREKLPDMSTILPGIMPSKKLPKKATSAQLERMVQETCVAELIHNLLCILGFGCVLLWKGAGGWIVAVLYMAGNIPFSVIQRYNRPKLVQIMQKLRYRELTIRSESK